MDNIIVALDVGTYKVSAVIAEIVSEDSLEIIGVGYASSQGIRRGVVVNIEDTLLAVSTAIEEAEAMAGLENKVDKVYTVIAGSHIESINSKGVVAVSSKDREISVRDIERVLEAAKAVVIPNDRQILHVIPQEFIVDGQRSIKNPVHFTGTRLEVEVHIITSSGSAIQNLINCINRAGFQVEGIIIESLAASISTLSQDEKDLGVMLIDIGAGTTDGIIYLDGSPFYTTILPYGSGMITQDISIILQISLEEAEKLKKDYGCAYIPLLEDDDEEIIIPGFGAKVPKSIKRSELAEYIQPRMHEIFSLFKKKVEKDTNLKDWASLGGGIVLTGGGSMLPGCAELASQIFGTSVKIGIPERIGGVLKEYQSPDFASSAGLLLEGLKNRNEQLGTRLGKKKEVLNSNSSNWFGIFGWFKDKFFN